MTNKTDSFQVPMAGTVLFQAMFTVILRMVDEKTTPCVDFVRQIVYFHGLMLLFAREYPEIIETIDKEIERFITDKTSRTKDITANIGMILVYTLFSEKYSFEDIIAAYFEEQLDRQVFWILIKIPELEHSSSNNFSLDENRVEITFMSQVISYLLVVFFHDYRKTVKDNFKTWNGMLESLENNGCKLDTKMEDSVLATFKEALTSIKSYSDYFQRIGLPKKNPVEINAMLKQAVKNSYEKRYHGPIDHVIQLPKKEEQIKTYLNKIPNLLNEVVDGKIKAHTEDQWKELCFARWTWMKEFNNADFERNNTPSTIAR